MNNYDQHDQIEQDILKHTPRQLARRIIELEEQLKESFIDGAECFGVSRDTALVAWETSDSKLKLERGEV